VLPPFPLLDGERFGRDRCEPRSGSASPRGCQAYFIPNPGREGHADGRLDNASDFRGLLNIRSSVGSGSQNARRSYGARPAVKLSSAAWSCSRV
jgi:hypothetical protein